MKPRKSSARITFSFHSASAATTTAPTTTAKTKARTAVCLTHGCSPPAGNGKPPQKLWGPMWTVADERTCWESRRHAVVLARTFARSFALALLGLAAFAVGWPVMLAGPPLVALAALGAALSVWRWERTRVVVTTEKLFVVHGTLRRRAAAVRLA